MTTGFGQRLGDRRVLRAPVGDAALAVALAAVGLAENGLRRPGLARPVARRTRDERGRRVVLALAWRRVAPVSVLLIVLGGFGGLAVAYGASQTSVTAFASGIAIYSAAAYGQSLALVAALTALGVVVRDSFDPVLVTLEDQVWSPLFAALAFAVGCGTRLHLRTRRMAEDNARALQREQEELVAAAVEDERRRIARELHDVVSHGLGVVVLQAGAAEQVLDDREEVRKILQSIRAWRA